jgi:hypothetical protein
MTAKNKVNPVFKCHNNLINLEVFYLTGLDKTNLFTIFVGSCLRQIKANVTKCDNFSNR